MRYLEEGIGLLTITVEGLRRLCQICKWLKYLGIMMSLERISSLQNLLFVMFFFSIQGVPSDLRPKFGRLSF